MPNRLFNKRTLMMEKSADTVLTKSSIPGPVKGLNALPTAPGHLAGSPAKTFTLNLTRKPPEQSRVWAFHKTAGLAACCSVTAVKGKKVGMALQQRRQNYI